MKTAIIASSILILATTAGWSAEPTPATPVKRPIMDLIALDWLGRATADTSLDTVLAAEGLSEPMLSRVKVRVTEMRAAQAQGLALNSRWFWMQLDGAGTSGGTGGGGNPPPAGSEKKDTDKAKALAKLHDDVLAKQRIADDPATKSDAASKNLRSALLVYEATKQRDRLAVAEETRKEAAKKEAAATADADKTKAQKDLVAARAEESAAFLAYRPYRGLLDVDPAKRTEFYDLSLGVENHYQVISEENTILANYPAPEKINEVEKAAKKTTEQKIAEAHRAADLKLAKQKVMQLHHAQKQENAVGPGLSETETRNLLESRERSAQLVVKALEEVQNDPKRTPFAFTHAGLQMLSPYAVIDITTPDPAGGDPIPTGRKRLDSSGQTAVGGFFEFVYTNVWAWRPSRQAQSFPPQWDLSHRQQNPPSQQDLPKFQWIGAGSRKEPHPQRLRNLLSNTWDLTSRLSFQFGQDEQPSAAAITGSGDFNAEVTLDKHLVRGTSDDGATAYSGNLGFTVAGVTDKSSFKVHPRFLVGPSVALNFADPFSSDVKPRSVWFRVRGGRAYIDTLHFADPDNSSEIALTLGGIPRYDSNYAWALESELYWPLRDYALLSMGARFYGKVRPAPWSISLGLTFPISEIADSLAPK